MTPRLRAVAATLMAALLLPAAARAEEEAATAPPEPGTAKVVFDAAVLRPLGFIGAAVGAIFVVPAIFLTAPNGRDGVESALEIFVLTPAKDVFERPLGDF